MPEITLTSGDHRTTIQIADPPKLIPATLENFQEQADRWKAWEDKVREDAGLASLILFREPDAVYHSWLMALANSLPQKKDY